MTDSIIPPFTLVRPTSLNEVQRLVAEAPDRRVLRSGGIDLIDHLKEGLSTPEAVVDLRHVADPSWTAIDDGDGVLRIGPRVTLAQLAASPATRTPALAALRDAAAGAATPSVRNVATVAGNLLQRPRCWYYRNRELVCLKKGGSVCLAVSGDNRYHAIFGGGPSYIVHPSTLAGPLTALDATLTTRTADGRERGMVLSDLFVPPSVDVTREHALEPGEVILRIDAKLAPNLRSGYRAAREKQSFDWPLAEASVALRLESGRMTDVRVVLGHVAPIPWRSAAAEAVLEGRAPGVERFAEAAAAAVADAQPLGDNRYKIPLTRGVLRHALHRATGVALPE